MSFVPYLFFSGDCAEAFQRYQEVLGGELEVMTHADLPPDAEPMPGATPEMVMHAALTVGDTCLYGSDDPTGDGGAKTGIGVAYSCSDAGEAKRIFDALSEGGEVQMPFAATFWSPGFGSCTDRYGVPWMIDTEAEPATG